MEGGKAWVLEDENLEEEKGELDREAGVCLLWCGGVP